jgi:predicted transcriptional regulator
MPENTIDSQFMDLPIHETQGKWQNTTVEQIMTSDPMYTVKSENDLNTALKKLAEHDVNQVLMLEDGRCTGLLSRADILNALQVSQGLGGKPE